MRMKFFGRKNKQAGKPQEAITKAMIEQEIAVRVGEVAVRDLIAPAAFKVNATTIELSGKFCRTLFVLSYPRYIYVGWFSPIINFDVPLDVSMFFYPMKSDAILKQLKKKTGNIEAQLMEDREKGSPRDPMRETALRDIESLRDQLTQGVERFFHFALYVTIYAESMEELDRRTEKVEGIFGARLVSTKRAFYQAEQGFNSSIPLGIDELAISFNMNSSPIASSFPFVSAELSSNSGVLYGINQHNNSLILFDRFSLANANCVVFATSGAGKSYMVKLEVLRGMMFGTRFIIIDPELEYKYLSDAVGGSYVNISLNSENKINPFDLPRAVGGADKPEDIIRSAVISVKGLLRIMMGSMNAEQDSVLDRAIVSAYESKDITPDADLATADPPLMQDLQNILADMEGGDDLARRLEKYTHGTFSGLFNAPTNIDVGNQLVVFSVRDLEDELRPLAIYNIINYVWNIVRSHLEKRVLVIDEAWWMLQHEDSAKFIFALVKRARKYYLGVTTITQDVSDFLGSPYGKAIVTNSALQVLLKQSSASIDMVKDTFLLTEGERYLLLEAAVGEGIFFAGTSHAAIKVVASYTEDQIITSDPRQLLEIEAAKRDFDEAIESDTVPTGEQNSLENNATAL